MYEPGDMQKLRSISSSSNNRNYILMCIKDVWAGVLKKTGLNMHERHPLHWAICRH